MKDKLKKSRFKLEKAEKNPEKAYEKIPKKKQEKFYKKYSLQRCAHNKYSIFDGYSNFA